MEKKILFSGIQPSGVIHIGNYLGALKQWVELQKKYSSIFCIVDLHAITVYQNPQELRKNILNSAKTLLALGIDPKKSIIFSQSDIPEHLELYWILNTITKVSELELMTQYKDKVAQGKIANAGLLNYPVLMASDILLYDTNAVPVGEDQIQHVELARELSRDFNNTYGKNLTEPEALIQKSGARIMGLDNPDKKMSKSASSQYNYIALTDSPKTIEDKIKRAVTDSGSEIKYDFKNKPGISNLITILSLVTGSDVKKIEAKYKGKNYGVFKKDVADTLIKFLSSFQSKYNKISDTQVKKVLSDGAKKAKKLASKKIDEVYKKVGLK
ncbi:MAG: tryptophan--tRNA ligase [Candidatus Paceibacterota bacterium]|jgi:tryptophanyl-tRNA synthetase